MTALGFDLRFIDQDINALYKVSSMTNNEKSIMNDYVNIMKYIEDNEPSEYKIYGLKIRLKNFLRQFLK